MISGKQEWTVSRLSLKVNTSPRTLLVGSATLLLSRCFPSHLTHLFVTSYLSAAYTVLYSTVLLVLFSEASADLDKSAIDKEVVQKVRLMTSVFNFFFSFMHYEKFKYCSLPDPFQKYLRDIHVMWDSADSELYINTPKLGIGWDMYLTHNSLSLGEGVAICGLILLPSR